MRFLIPFTCDFAIYPPLCFKTAKYGAVFWGNGSKDLYQVSRHAVFVPEGETRLFRGP